MPSPSSAPDGPGPRARRSGCLRSTAPILGTADCRAAGRGIVGGCEPRHRTSRSLPQRPRCVGKIPRAPAAGWSSSDGAQGKTTAITDVSHRTAIGRGGGAVAVDEHQRHLEHVGEPLGAVGGLHQHEVALRPAVPAASRRPAPPPHRGRDRRRAVRARAVRPPRGSRRASAGPPSACAPCSALSAPSRRTPTGGAGAGTPPPCRGSAAAVPGWTPVYYGGTDQARRASPSG